MLLRHFPETSKTSGFDYEAMYLERLLPYRAHVAAVLRGDGFAKRYIDLLNKALQKAEWLFGPRFSSRALIVCVFLSLIYTYTLFWLSVAGGWENPLASAAQITPYSKMGYVGLLYTVVFPTLMWPIGRFMGYREIRIKMGLRRKHNRKHRRLWASTYSGLIIFIITILLLLVSELLSYEKGVQFVFDFLHFLFGFLGFTLAASWGGKTKTLWQALLAGTIAVASTMILARFLLIQGAISGLDIRASAMIVTALGFVVLAKCVTVDLALAGFLVLVGAISISVFGGGSAPMYIALAILTVSSLSVVTGISRVHLFAVLIGGFFGMVGSMGRLDYYGPGPGLSGLTVFLLIAMVFLPLQNAALDFLSWWFSRWMGEKLHHVLTSVHDTVRRINTAFLHGLADVILALIFFACLAWILGFTFELFDLWADLKEVNLWNSTTHPQSGYITEIRDNPLGTGLWITLMLLSTLIPTIIHLGFVIVALVPMILLPDYKRLRLADNLDALAKVPFNQELNPESIDIIRQAASYASTYRRRVVTSNLAATSLLFGVITLFISLQWSFGLDEAAFQAGVKGIEFARWLWRF